MPFSAKKKIAIIAGEIRGKKDRRPFGPQEKRGAYRREKERPKAGEDGGLHQKRKLQGLSGKRGGEATPPDKKKGENLGRKHRGEREDTAGKGPGGKNAHPRLPTERQH